MSLQSRFKKAPAPPPVPFTGPRLLSPEAAANYLGHSVDLVYEMLRDGVIPYVKKGSGKLRSQYVIDRLDLDKWIESKKAVA